MHMWALENASDELVAIFGCTIIIFFVVISIIVFIDWIKKKKNAKK